MTAKDHAGGVPPDNRKDPYANNIAQIKQWQIEHPELTPQVNDLPTQDSKPSTGYSKAQRIAEYKQLLASLPSPAKPKTDTDKGWNGALEACRALIEARIKELE